MLFFVLVQASLRRRKWEVIYGFIDFVLSVSILTFRKETIGLFPRNGSLRTQAGQQVVTNLRGRANGFRFDYTSIDRFHSGSYAFRFRTMRSSRRVVRPRSWEVVALNANVCRLRLVLDFSVSCRHCLGTVYFLPAECLNVHICLSSEKGNGLFNPFA